MALKPTREGFSAAGALSEFSEGQLLNLLRARPDLATPPPKDLAVLAARASSWASINSCIVTLNRASQQLLDALCLLPQPTTVRELLRLLDTKDDGGNLAGALGRLVDLALVFRTGEELRVHPQLDGLRNPAGLGPPASSVLASQPASALDAMARHLGMKPERNKQEMLASVVAALAEPARIQRALRDAPAGTSDLAARLAEHSVGTVPGGTYYIRANTPLGWMAERGLVVATDWETIVMPREVGLALRGGRPFPDFRLRPPAIPWRPVDADSTDRACAEQAMRIVTDVATILDSWQDAPAKLLKAGGIGIRDVRRAATAVGRSEIETARLIELAAVAGLAGWDAATATALPGTAYDDWLDLDLADRWMALVTAWLDSDLHVNLAGALGTNEKPIPPLLDRWPEGAARHRRALVLAAWLEGGCGQAADDESLTARVTWDAPAIWTGGPARPPMLVSWVREEAQMLGICASGALGRLGRAVVTGRVDQALAELAAHAPRITSQFVIQADLTAVATGPLPTTIRCELELMADLESSGAATVYRFSEQSLRRAYDAGRTTAEINGFLTARAAKGVPQPLAYLVEDIGRRHGRVRVGSATCYVRSDDPSLLAEILVARRAAKLGLRPLAPTVLISTSSPETVVATLRASGYLPAEEDDASGLVVRRRVVRRATAGHGPKRGRAPDATASRSAPARASELAQILADRDLLASVGQLVAGAPAQHPDLESLVRRLRSPRPGTVAGSQPPPARAQPVNGAKA
ncbi:MAG: helicase-associated domain-containing protein, partial [Actinomycetota bacterium]|nr:helicase-associated domain-containing protein [Actinomycetota bacterium]